VIPAPVRRLLNRVVAFSAVLSLADFIFGAVYVSALVLKGLSPAMIGVLFGISTALSLVVEAPSGVLGDRFGHRRMLIAGLALWGAGLVVVAFGETWPVVLAGLILWTAGMALQSGTIEPIMVAHADDVDRQTLFGRLMRLRQVARWAFSALGALVVFLLGDAVSTSLLIALSGALILVLVPYCWLTLPESPSRKNQSVREILRGTFGWMTRSEAIPISIGAFACGIASTTIIVSWQPSLVTAGDIRMSGIYLVLLSAAAGVGAALTRYRKSGHHKQWTLVSLVIIAAGLLTASIVGTPWALAGFAVAEAGLGAVGVTFATWQHLEFTDELRNTLQSTFSTLGLVSSLVADLAIGALWDRFGISHAVFLMAALLLAATIVLAVLTVRRRPA